MPNAAIAKRMVEAFTDQSRRRSALIDGAIIHAGVKPRPIRTSEGFADAANGFIKSWNHVAEQIEGKFGKGYFPARLEHALATAIKFVNVTPAKVPSRSW